MQLYNFIAGLTNINVRFNFRMYLVWKYPPTATVGTTIYTIGTLDWTVYFQAEGEQLLTVGPNAEAPHALGTFDPNNHQNPIVTPPLENTLLNSSTPEA